MKPVPEDPAALVEAAASRDGPGRTRAAARLMTLLEGAPHRLPELFRRLPLDSWPRPRLVLGITGAPGAGKSSVVDALLAELRRRGDGRPIGVIAVDPSSPFTGGAVLGDRVRMMRHATDPGVFIRSLASRGHLGGLSLGVKGVLRVMGLVGCELVLIETVGVGQSEVEVARVADRVVVVLAPGGGDSVQLLKAGLMEVGDLFVVNKADTPGADALHRALLQALRLSDTAGADGVGHGGPPDADARVHLVSASDGTGMSALADALIGGAAGRADARSAVRTEVREAVLEAARRRLESALDGDPEAVDAVLDGRTPVAALVERLFAEQRGT